MEQQLSTLCSVFTMRTTGSMGSAGSDSAAGGLAALQTLLIIHDLHHGLGSAGVGTFNTLRRAELAAQP